MYSLFDTNERKSSHLYQPGSVLTLWAAVVAERLGFRRDEALTLGRAVAGLNAYSKGVSLGLFRPSPKTVKDRRNRLTRGRRLKIDVLRRAVPVVRTRMDSAP